MAKRNATTELNDRNWDQEEEAEEPGRYAIADESVLAQRKIKVARRRKLSGGEPGDTKSPFKGFAGFTGLAKPAASSAPTFNFGSGGTTSTSLFNFGTKPLSNGSNSAEKKTTSTTVSAAKGNGTEAEPPKPTFSFGLQSTSVAAQSDEAKPPFSFGSTNSSQSSVLSPTNSTDSPSKASKAKYYSKLKTLNESVSKWIKEHVDKNPLCILTPIFKDYETHLAEIERLNPDSLKKEEITVEKDKVSIKSDSKASPFPTFSFTKAAESSDQKSSPFTETTLSTSGTTQMSFTPAATDVNKPPQGGFSFTSSTNSSNLLGSTGSTTSGFSFKPLAWSEPEVGDLCLMVCARIAVDGSSYFVETSASKANTGTSGGSGGGEDEEYVPPTVEVKTITEEGAVYTKRCKLFYKLDKEWKDKGVGNLHIKPVEGGKTQLIVRADNNLGTILLNILLSEMVPTSRQGKNNVMMVTVPNPPIKGIEGATPMLIRVKTSDDADELLEKLNEHKA